MAFHKYPFSWWSSGIMTTHSNPFLLDWGLCLTWPRDVKEGGCMTIAWIADNLREKTFLALYVTRWRHCLALCIYGDASPFSHPSLLGSDRYLKKKMKHYILTDDEYRARPMIHLVLEGSVSLNSLWEMVNLNETEIELNQIPTCLIWKLIREVQWRDFKIKNFPNEKLFICSSWMLRNRIRGRFCGGTGSGIELFLDDCSVFWKTIVKESITWSVD